VTEVGRRAAIDRDDTFGRNVSASGVGRRLGDGHRAAAIDRDQPARSACVHAGGDGHGGSGRVDRAQSDGPAGVVRRSDRLRAAAIDSDGACQLAGVSRRYGRGRG